jgi:maltooligosyltrehalose trehalohydrolase
VPERAGVRFRVLADASRNLRLQLLGGASAGTYGLEPESESVQSCFVDGAGAGDRYRYVIDGSESFPDPASRFQPEGVHGPSEIVDPEAFRWRHESWRGRTPRELTIYELHVGTFTDRGTFNAARHRLAQLRDLGVTAIELMPLAEYAGTRNWGYDGVALYAPSRNYGRPDDLRAFVDTAHGFGIAVILDVVYNHLGPEGAYLMRFYPAYLTDRHQTPWGGAINLDGEGSSAVRRFIVDNAVAWISEYHLDGLRLDATHALIDNSPAHIVPEIAAAAREAAGWPIAIHAEDHRNLASLLEPANEGGWGLDGVWADDLHHVLRSRLAGDRHGYYQDYTGSLTELARTMRQGWLYTGQHSSYGKAARGTDPSRLPMQQFVVCLQNHDQIGNRAEGDRLHHAIDAAAWRAASTLLLTCPMTPLLFMGQEWGASSPFQYFTDLEPELGAQVTEGRRREFKDFPKFTDPAARAAIPDPQDPRTFERSRLDWKERERQPHAGCLALYTDLLHLRSSHRALAASEAASADATALDDATIALRREEDGERFVIVVRLDGAGTVSLPGGTGIPPTTIFTTEDQRYVEAPSPIDVQSAPHRVTLAFSRPGAIILKY